MPRSRGPLKHARAHDLAQRLAKLTRANLAAAASEPIRDRTQKPLTIKRMKLCGHVRD
jgi:hypothetical protein